MSRYLQSALQITGYETCISKILVQSCGDDTVKPLNNNPPNNNQPPNKDLLLRTQALYKSFKPAYPLGAHGVETDHSYQDRVCKATKFVRHAPPFSKNGRSLKFVITLAGPRLSSARSIHSQSVKTEHLLLQNEFILVRNNNHDHLVLF